MNNGPNDNSNDPNDNSEKKSTSTPPPIKSSTDTGSASTIPEFPAALAGLTETGPKIGRGGPAPIVKITQPDTVAELTAQATRIADDLVDQYEAAPRELNKQITIAVKELTQVPITIMIDGNLKKAGPNKGPVQPMLYTTCMQQLWGELFHTLTEENLSALRSTNIGKVHAIKTPILNDERGVSQAETVDIQKINFAIKELLVKMSDSAKDLIDTQIQTTRSEIKGLDSSISMLAVPATLKRLKMTEVEAEKRIEGLILEKAELEADSAHRLEIMNQQKKSVDALLEKFDAAQGDRHTKTRAVFNLITKPLESKKAKEQPAEKANKEGGVTLDEDQQQAVYDFIYSFLLRPEDRARLESFVELNGDRVGETIALSTEDICSRLRLTVMTGPNKAPLELAQLVGILSGQLGRDYGFLLMNNPGKNLREINPSNRDYTEELYSELMGLLKIDRAALLDLSGLAGKLASSSSPNVGSLDVGSSSQSASPLTFSSALKTTAKNEDSGIVSKKSGLASLKKATITSSSTDDNTAPLTSDQAKGAHAISAIERVAAARAKAADDEHAKDIVEGRAETLMQRLQNAAVETLSEATANRKELSREDTEALNGILSLQGIGDNPQIQERLKAYGQKMQHLETKTKHLERELSIAQEAVMVARSQSRKAIKLSGRTPLDIARQDPTQEGLVAAARLWREQNNNQPIDAKTLDGLAQATKNSKIRLRDAFIEANKDEPSLKTGPKKL